MATKKVDRSLLKGDCIEAFRSAIRSPATLDPYERKLIHFLKAIKLTPDEFVALAKKKPQEAEKRVLSFIAEEKKRIVEGQIAVGTLNNSIKSARLLLEMNDVILNWKKMKRVLPKGRRYALDRMPTEGELREILDAADIRGKALTLVLVSSGIREGAIAGLRVGDYSKMGNVGSTSAGKLIVYHGDPEQYVAFITPEACLALDKYLDHRREHGETVSVQSPLFRDKFDAIKGGSIAAKATPMSGDIVRHYYNRLLRAIGIRNERKKRHEFSVHGFRKFFKTKAEIAGVKPINVETLMGHSIGISDSYYRPSENDLLQDYVKAIDQLTISKEKQLRQENDKLKIENAEIDIIKKSYLDMKLELDKRDEREKRRDEEMEHIYKALYKEGIIKKKKKDADV